MAQQGNQGSDPDGALERELRAAHEAGVTRPTLERMVEMSRSVSDVGRVRCRKTVGELCGDKPAAAKPPAARNERTSSKRRVAPAAVAAPIVDGQPAAQNLEAETHLLGAMMLSAAAITAARATGLTPAEFHHEERHGFVYQACLDLADQGVQVDTVTVIAELEKQGRLAKAGGRVKVHELAALAAVPGNAAHYATIVREHARRRNIGQAAQRLATAAVDGHPTDQLEAALAAVIEQPATITVRERLVPGGAFILDRPADVAALWADDDAVAWAAGEGLMLCGPQGAGKTTIAQQLALARIGLRAELLGMPVQPDDRPVLYIAADRPRQVQRSFARMAAPPDRPALDGRLVVHAGPLDQLVDRDPLVLSRLARRAGAGTVIVDSLKDLAGKLTDDEVGGMVNLAYQHLLADDVELVVLHHQRKEQQGAGKPKRLDDVYGSSRLTSGLGSVILLWADEAGALLVELSHLKPVTEPLGPWQLQHDHARGATGVVDKPDLLDIVYRAGANGVTPQDAAVSVYGADKTGRNAVERVRGRLDRLADRGKVVKIPAAGRGDHPRYVYHGGAAEGR